MPREMTDEAEGTGMFWYAIQLVAGSNDADDWRFTDDRGMAIMAMKVCGLKVRVCAKPV
jgi:hypothetical protein